jgi:hypothetical protein
VGRVKCKDRYGTVWDHVWLRMKGSNKKLKREGTNIDGKTDRTPAGAKFKIWRGMKRR